MILSLQKESLYPYQSVPFLPTKQSLNYFLSLYMCIRWVLHTDGTTHTRHWGAASFTSMYSRFTHVVYPEYFIPFNGSMWLHWVDIHRTAFHQMTDTGFSYDEAAARRTHVRASVCHASFPRVYPEEWDC